MVYHQINENSFKKDMFRGENIMLSTSTSNSSFQNANVNVGEYENDDRIQILDCDSTRTYHEPLSQTRRIFFIASIIATFLIVFVFLLLPCESDCVKDKNPIEKATNWITYTDKLEFKGDINTVVEKKNGPRALIFMFRMDKIFPDVEMSKGLKKHRNTGGIAKVNSATGHMDWENYERYEPRTMDCDLIDCNRNGNTDCLILDDFGQLQCLGVNGRIIFNVPFLKASKLIKKDLLDFPLILPDLNGDGVNDIMMTTPNENTNTTDLLIVSGRNGLHFMRESQNCSYVHKLQLEENYIIKYVCIVKENSEQQMIRNLTDFYIQMMTKKPLDLKKLQPVSKIKQHKYYGKRPSTERQLSITMVEDKKLTVANIGSWPRDSKATLTLTTQVKGVEKILFNRTYNKVYAMVPVPLALNSTVNGRKNDNIHGFVVKLWIWNGTEINYNLEKSRLKRSTEKRDLKAQRSNYTNQTYAAGSAYKTKIFFLKESIMLIIFNNSNMKIENASQSNIVQFCQRSTNPRDKKGEVDSICHPDMNYQENSVLVTDLDGDGSKELVSYYTTYVNDNKPADAPGDRWKLKTYAQLFKLETELPKLYSDLPVY